MHATMSKLKYHVFRPIEIDVGSHLIHIKIRRNACDNPGELDEARKSGTSHQK
jgi:hypothetical protein